MSSASDPTPLINLFVYGTLMDAGIMCHVSGRRFRCEAATLSGYVRKRVRDEVYPAITERAGQQVAGVLCYGVGGPALERLDRFEGAPYERIPVRVATGQGVLIEAQAYVFKAKSLAQLSDEDWCFEEFQKTAKRYFREKYWGCKGGLK